jgi:cyanophycin synthetase
MRILSIQVLPGANIYSFRPVIRAKLDLGEYEDVPSSAIPNFTERLVSLLPGLREHQCSRGYPGGFVERLQEGTYLAHILEHVALELQCMAGYEINFGKARSTGVKGVYAIIIGYQVAPAAIRALYTAEKLMMAIIQDKPFAVEDAMKQIVKAGQEYALGPSTAAIWDAAKNRGIPVSRVANENFLMLGYGRRQHRVWTTITDQTSALATDLAGDKGLTKTILAESGIPVPEGVVTEDKDGVLQALRLIGGPVAVKPANGNQGKGVTLGVATDAEAERAFNIALEYDKRVVVEEYIAGRQFRICVVNGKMVAAAERIPAYVIGDGQNTVRKLVEGVNIHPSRGEGHEKPLTKIVIDTVAVTVLGKQGLTPESVPEPGKVIYIRENANLSTGGTAVDVTEIVHPETVALAERAAMLIGLDVAGVDLVAKDITKPLTGGGGAIIEVNAAPGIRMHHYPSAGKPRDVAASIVNYLFPDGETGRIPIIAITGTNGKTTVSRMIGHIWQLAGFNVGMTTTDGIYLNGQRLLAGDTTGPSSARAVLSDPRVDVAVLETARGGIVRGGLAFDACDVGIITNITDDHFGQDGIENIEDLVHIKSLIIETVAQGGYTLLNADDCCVTNLAPRGRGEIAYISTEADNLIIRRHLSIGGKAFFVKDGVIHFASGKRSRSIVKVTDIPVTLGGVAQHNIQNAVIAAAACCCLKVPISYIRRGLSTFEENPGRLNMLSIGDFRVCVDYGHNPAGYQALISTVKRLGADRLVGVIAAPGDRRNDVIINIGRIAGRGFDYIYIKEDSDLRGREEGKTAELLKQGVIEAGFKAERVTTILSEEDAVAEALARALPGDLIVIFYEDYEKVMAVIKEFRTALQQRLPAGANNYDKVLVGEVKSL